MFPRIFFVLAILFITVGSVFAQEKDSIFFHIDSLTEVLKHQEFGSQELGETLLELELRFYYGTKDENLTQEERVRLMNASLDLTMKRGIYTFLDPTYKPDTLNVEVVKLGNELRQLQDSISKIQSRLIEIIEDKDQTWITRERSTQILATIHKQEVLAYLFENEQDLQFGKISSEMDDQEAEASSRTALTSVIKEYYETETWLLFPFLFKSLNRLDYMDMGLIHNFLTYPVKYKSLWLLLEFMHVNASPESKPVIEGFMEGFDYFKRPKDKD